METKIGDLIWVAWRDAVQPHPGWELIGDMTADLMSCFSVGWVVRFDPDILVLVPNVADIGTESEQGSGYFQIPTSAIRDISILRLDEYGKIDIPARRDDLKYPPRDWVSDQDS